jgi:two-component system, OmpR family, phosphate regulon sensor histidine kinase PhoR
MPIFSWFRTSNHKGELEEAQFKIARLTENLNKSESDKNMILADRNRILVALSNLNEGVIAVNTSKQVTIFNKAAERLTGFMSSEVINKPIDQLIKLFDGNNELNFMHYCPVTNANIEGIIFQKTNLTMKGRLESHINLTSIQVRQEGDANLGCILTFSDYTKESHLESMKTDFVSMAAHELRTPLTSIKGYLSVFLTENKDKLSEDQSSLLNNMQTATDQLTGLVENLLSVSRIERGVLNVSLEDVDWITIVENAVSIQSDSAKQRQIELAFTKPTEALPKIKVDKIRINEVLNNLIANAIKYTEPSGKITVWIENKSSDIITHISDTGHGIPKEAIPNLFNKFFRISGALEQGTKGTGLGLYITKSLVEMMHGKIWVESELNKGSTFSFSLPI